MVAAAGKSPGVAGDCDFADRELGRSGTPGERDYQAGRLESDNRAELGRAPSLERERSDAESWWDQHDAGEERLRGAFAGAADAVAEQGEPGAAIGAGGGQWQHGQCALEGRGFGYGEVCGDGAFQEQVAHAEGRAGAFLGGGFVKWLERHAGCDFDQRGGSLREYQLAGGAGEVGGNLNRNLLRLTATKVRKALSFEDRGGAERWGVPIQIALRSGLDVITFVAT